MSAKAVAKVHQGSELPPTEDDREMSVRHHKDSVAYNLRHSTDHFDATADHIKRLSKVSDPKTTATQARKAAQALAKMQRKIQPFLGKDEK